MWTDGLTYWLILYIGFNPFLYTYLTNGDTTEVRHIGRRFFYRLLNHWFKWIFWFLIRLAGIASVLWSLLLYFSNKTGVKWFVCCLASKLGSDAQSDSSKMAAMAYFMLAKVEFAETEKFKVPRASIVSYCAQVCNNFKLIINDCFDN